MKRKLATLALLALVAFTVTSCGFANNMTGQVIRSIPNTVLRSGSYIAPY